MVVRGADKLVFAARASQKLIDYIVISFVSEQGLACKLDLADLKLQSPVKIALISKCYVNFSQNKGIFRMSRVVNFFLCK